MLSIEYINIEEIKPYKNNAKLHPQEQIEQIKKSIEDFGFNDPLAIWNGEIIEGHGRYLAAKEMGISTLPVIKLDNLTDEQRRAYTLVHNKLTLNSGFDLDLLNEELKNILDFDMEDYGFTSEDEEEEEEQEVEEDDYLPRVSEPPKTKPGDRYKLGNHILLCGDSTDPNDMAKLMQGTTADLLITDPPYNVDIGIEDLEEAKRRHRRTDGLQIENDKQTDSDFIDFLVKLFTNAIEVLKPGGAYYIWYADGIKATLFWQAYKEAGLNIKQSLVWVKNSLVLGRQDYHYQHEPCVYGWKDGGAHYFIDDRTQTTVYEDAKPDIKKMKKEELISLLEDIFSDKQSTTVMHEKKPAVSDLHPTMKPIKLLARQIKNSTKQGEIVLDTCGGSGSTLIACEQLNRTCYTMEIDPHYCDVIVDRWQLLTGKQAIKD